MKWWEKESLRIFEFFDAYALDSLSLEQQADLVASLGCNVQHFHCLDLLAKETDEGFLFQTKLAKVKNRDRLGEYLPMAHRRGIKVVVYMNVHSYSKKFGETHPDWRQIKQDGIPINDVYSINTSFCINSPYRQWVFQMVRDLCDYRIDGIFLDGPIFFADTCYCKLCQELFDNSYHRRLPLKSDKKSADWQALLEFQSDSIARFLSDIRKITKDSGRDILLCMNGNSNWPFWPTGRDNHKIIRHTDMLGAEGGFLYGDLNQSLVFKPGVAAKLLDSQAGGKPAVVFNCAGHKQWLWYMLPKTEIGLLYAETLAHGANVWMVMLPDDIHQVEEVEVVKEYNGFIIDNPEPFHRTESLSKVALFWPNYGINFYEGISVPLTDFTQDIKGGTNIDSAREFEGFYEALVKCQTPFDVIDEQASSLDKYELVVLPNVACLQETEVLKIRDFVRGGGNLLSTFESSLYDGRGEKLENFQLGDVFGVRFPKKMFGPMYWDYVMRNDESRGSIFSESKIAKKYLPAPVYGLDTKLCRGAEAELFYAEPLKGCIESTPRISSTPFFITNRYGKGTSVYLAGTFGESLNRFRFPEYLEILRAIIRKSVFPVVTIENAPHVEISVRKKAGYLFIHLINLTTGLKRPITSVHNIKNLRMHIMTNPHGIKSARALKTGKNLRFQRRNDGISLVLPSLELYEIVSLDLK